MSFSAAITATIGADVAPLQAAGKQVERIGEDIGRGFATKLAAGFSAAGAIAAFTALGKGAIELAGRLADTAANLGINVEALQVLEAMHKRNGIAGDAFSAVLGKLRNSVIEAAQGNEKAAQALATLGLNAKALLSLPLEEQYASIAKAALSAKDGNAAFNAVSQIFGEKIGPRLMGSLKELAENGYPAVAAQARDAGQVMSAETIAALDRAGDAIDDFKLRATVAVGNIIVNFRTSEGLELMGLQLLKVVGTFGAGILDALTEANNFVKAVFAGAWAGIANNFRDRMLDVVSLIASKINSILPEKFEINVAGLESLKSAGKSVAEEITAAIAKTEPATFKKDVAAYWDKAIGDQQKIVDDLNRIEFKTKVEPIRQAAEELPKKGAEAAKNLEQGGKATGAAVAAALETGSEKMKKAGQTVGEAIMSASLTFEESAALWGEHIDNALKVWKEVSGAIAGIRGGTAFNDASTEALGEVARRNRQRAADLRNPALGVVGIGQDLEAGRLQAEAMNAEREISLRSKLRQNVELLGVEGARRQFSGDPLLFDRLVQQFTGQMEKADVTNKLLEEIKRGQTASSIALEQAFRSAVRSI